MVLSGLLKIYLLIYWLLPDLPELWKLYSCSLAIQPTIISTFYTKNDSVDVLLINFYKADCHVAA